MNANRTLPRRTLLKGLALGAGAVVLRPLIERISLAAEGKTPPTRFLFVVEGNALPPKQIHPLGIPFLPREKREKVTVQSLAELELPPSLAPVKEFKDRMAIIQGLSGRMCSGGHSSDHGTLGAYHANGGRNIQAPTIDGLLGKTFPGIFPNVVLGISANPNDAVLFNCSADTPRRSLATICQPNLAFERLFGSVADGKVNAAFTAKRNLLDYMGNDVRRLEKRLGSVDREKLDAYMGSFETLRQTSDRLVAVSDRLRPSAPTASDKYRSAVETDRLDAHFELLAAAMIAGLTNVGTIASGVGVSYFNITFKGLGIDMAKHPMGHAMYNQAERAAWEMSEKIRAFHFQLIARFMNKLKGIPEGDGTMLDNTVVVYVSDGAEAHHSNCFEWPFVVLGNARGKLRTDGRYVQIPDYGKPGHRTINTLFNTLLHAASVPRDDFGMLDPNLDRGMLRGPISELLA